MKILGIGVDIVENKRIQKSIKNPLFKKRIYSFKELKQSNAVNNKVAYFSKRFAAKEAFSKALGTGISSGINFNEIVVLNKKSGKPYISFVGKTKKILNKKFQGKKSKVSLSLSDEKNMQSLLWLFLYEQKKNYLHNLWQFKNINWSFDHSYFN